MSGPGSAGIQGDVNRGLAWVGLAASAVGVLDITALVLVLKLWVSPVEFGVVTAVVTLFGALELAAEMGLAAAVVQRDDHDDERLSTVFWMSFLFGGVFYGLILLAAPFVARLHGHPIIVPLFQVYGVNLILRAGYSTHQALLKKQLRFRELSLVRIVANLADFAVKIGTAAAGYGLWCFVWGTLARSLVNAIGLPIVQGWRPRLVFQPRRTAPYLAFGLRASAGEILYQLYSNLDYQIVGITFGAAALGLYRAAYELVLEPIRFVSGVVVGVAFPAFAHLRGSTSAVVEQLIGFTRQNLVVVLSLVAVILVEAEDLLIVIFKAEYVGGAMVARLLAIVGVLRALSHLGPPLLDGLGRPDLTLRYQGSAAALLTLLFFSLAELLGDRVGALSVALGWALGYPLAFLVLAAIVVRLTGLSPARFLRRVAGIPACVAIAGAVGAAARLLLDAWPPAPRLAVVAPLILGLVAFLLARFQGISPRSVRAALRGEQVGPPVDSPRPPIN